MLWVRAAVGIRLDGTVMHYKLQIRIPVIYKLSSCHR